MNFKERYNASTIERVEEIMGYRMTQRQKDLLAIEIKGHSEKLIKRHIHEEKQRLNIWINTQQVKNSLNPNHG